MKLLFIEILNMSITAGITAFAVITIRMMLKKHRRFIHMYFGWWCYFDLFAQLPLRA